MVTHVCAHNRGLFESNKLQVSIASISLRLDGHIAECSLALGDFDLEIESGLKVRLVKARESPSSIARLKLSAQHVIEISLLGCARACFPDGCVLGAVKARHNVIHGSSEVDGKHNVRRRKVLRELERNTLRGLVI